MTDRDAAPRSDVEEIEQGRTALGIELGSTRIKAVLTGSDLRPLAAGSSDWENAYVDRLWTYSLDAVWSGLQKCFASLAAEVRQRYGVELDRIGALGVSAMMHGYLAFDVAGELLVPFRTWRNTNTGAAAAELSELFGHNIPHRWSVAHLHQAISDGEDHVGRIAHLTTLAGYVHWQLSGEQVLGVGDASGMFPIDVSAGDYDATMLSRYDDLVADRELGWSLHELLPVIRTAGESAGELTAAGARRLDPSGRLAAGAPMCPPEGDAGTGMVATNSVAPRTGNVSAGTSIFAMVVLERELSRVHRELDLVTTPAGDPVAMVHCNNGASELNAWAGLFADFAQRIGADVDSGAVFRALFSSALEGAVDGDGVLAYNYLSGEPITDLEEGRPLVVRTPGSRFDLATFMRVQLFSALATLRVGMDVLQQEENVRLERLFAHGGIFKTEGVAQRFLASALDTPVAVGDIAAEGGAWGIAVLAAFRAERVERSDRSVPSGSSERSLAEFLNAAVFADATLVTAEPEPADALGFAGFMDRWRAALPVQRAAVEHT